MGNSVSCFDPVREHPPYSWPKDHPGRDAAIAEKRRQRQQEKIVGSKGNESEVPMESAKYVQEGTTKPDKSVVDTQEDEVKRTKEIEKIGENLGSGEATSRKRELDSAETEDSKEEPTKSRESQSHADDHLHSNVSRKATSTHRSEVPASCQSREEPDQETESLGRMRDVDNEAFHEDESLRDSFVPENSADNSPERGIVAYVRAEDRLECPAAIDILNNFEEGYSCATDIAPVDQGYHGETARNARSQDEKGTRDINNKGMEIVGHVDDGIPPDKDVRNPWQGFDDRLPAFGQSVDEFPQPKEFSRDVHDPVTGNLIALAEYRGRQMARAEGLVRERVEQYEEVVNETAKEIAEHAAIDAVRNEVIGRHQWRFKIKEVEEHP